LLIFSTYISKTQNSYIFTFNFKIKNYWINFRMKDNTSNGENNDLELEAVYDKNH